MAAAELLKPSQAGVDEDFVNEVCHSWSWHQLERLMCRVTRPFLATAPPVDGFFLHCTRVLCTYFSGKKEAYFPEKKETEFGLPLLLFFSLDDMTYCCMPVPVLL